MKKCFVFIQVFLFLFGKTNGQQRQLFNNGWEFVKDIDSNYSISLLSKASNIRWEKVSLPHTANIEPIAKIDPQWQGICYYRKFFTVPSAQKGKHVAIQFDAAMQEADVYLNGQHIFNHQGGYLPFYINLSDKIKFDQENNIVVRLDNRDNKFIPPGKPLKRLDFNYYSGIYRNAWFTIKEKLYINNPIAANTIAGGGVFVHFENVSDKVVTVNVRTDVQNDFADAKKARIRAVLKDKSGRIVAQASSREQIAEAGRVQTFTQKLILTNPKLWSPDAPYLYQLTVEVLENGKPVDREMVTTGVRTVKIQNGSLYLNAKKIKIRGTNRHQEYPYVGNAASDNAQYRDVWKMKQAGFNFVRSSHYPQSPSFLDACDELGLLVMDAIPGWQYAGTDSLFLRNSYQDIRDMIRRDRNHPSIILWEASLNESGMTKEYMEKAHAIVHEELNFPGVYSAGWLNTVYDVFLPARQHGKATDYWKKYDGERPLLIAEYGDWEYYAQNAGFNQTAYQDLKREERSSRQQIGWGEKRLLQQALNYQEAHNDNLYGADLGDANWLMFDYNRGYALDIESSGIMDMVRLPKFSFYFYQSQIDPVVTNSGPFNKPMVFVANYWQTASDTAVRIFSNCNEVELFLNGKSLGKQKPDKDSYSTNLKHPPFTFHLKTFTPGSLTAVGYINNKKAAEYYRKTPEAATKINLRVDYSNKDLTAGRNDVVFVYAEITDNNGTIIYNAKDKVEFKVSGDAEIIGQNPRPAEAGTATVLIKAGAKAGPIVITAKAGDLKQAAVTINSK